MSVDQLTQAIVTGINAGAEQFLEGTLAAVLPVIWLAIMGLHLRDFRLVTILLLIGSVFYFVPYVLGVQYYSVAQGGPFASISNFLVTNQNPNWAVGVAYVSVALLAIMGAIATIYALRTGGR